MVGVSAPDTLEFFLVAIIVVTGVLLARKPIPKKSIEVTLVEISKRSVKQEEATQLVEW